MLTLIYLLKCEIDLEFILLKNLNSDVKGESDQVSTEIEVGSRKVFEVRKNLK